MRSSDPPAKENNKTDTRLSEAVLSQIHFLRGHKVILDSDLASLYGVATKALVQAVKRNPERFPDDFMFQLKKQELAVLRSQTVTLKRGQHSKYLPYTFTEQGVAMLSSVLRSKKAVLVNIEIMRAFVNLRQLLAGNKQLARKLDELEKKYDTQFKEVFDAIKALMTPVATSKRPIGFRSSNEDDS